MVTTDPRQFVSDAEKRALATVSADARFLRYGGDCYCYTQLAMGLVDVVIENGLQAYDVQALIPIVEAAGGRITDWSGGPCDQGGPVLACGDAVSAQDAGYALVRLKGLAFRPARPYKCGFETRAEAPPLPGCVNLFCAAVSYSLAIAAPRTHMRQLIGSKMVRNARRRVTFAVQHTG